MNGIDWPAFITTFGLVFVAELGDKTQLAVVTQTCKHRRPWAVFWGASLALTAVTALGAVGGRVLGQIVPAPVLRGIAALAFVVMGILVGQQAARARPGRSLAAACDHSQGQEEGTGCTSNGCSDWKAFGSTLGLLFLAELGDKTQLATFSFAARSRSPVCVFIGAGCALLLTTLIAALFGEAISSVVPEKVMRSIAGILFVTFGVLMLIGKW